jgi:hypothetical protein
MVSFVNYASDLFQVEVSHLYNPKTLQFTLIVHIPLVSNANLLELYKFLPLPIHFNFSSNLSITPDVGQNNLLAIGHSKSFQTISSSDLHSCLHLGDTFFCKGRKVIETSLKKSCLGSLNLANSRRDSKQLQIQGCGGFRADFRIGRKYLGGILNGYHQHQPGVPSQEHDPDPPNQLRRHSHSGARMLHPDYGSRDLSGRI